jgi:hypothetical protein
MEKMLELMRKKKLKEGEPEVREVGPFSCTTFYQKRREIGTRS